MNTGITVTKSLAAVVIPKLRPAQNYSDSLFDRVPRVCIVGGIHMLEISNYRGILYVRGQPNIHVTDELENDIQFKHWVEDFAQANKMHIEWSKVAGDLR